MSGLRHLNHEDQERIRAALAVVEQRTHAHFTLVVTPVSDRYALYPVLWGAILALIAGGALALGWPHLSLRFGFGIEALVFVGLSLVFDWLPIRLLLVPKHFKHTRARNFARREFAARVLSDRAHRNGVLFFVSQGERYVEILASPDVHAHVGEAAWQAIVADFITAVKDGRSADGFITGIQACGSVLAAHYPAGPLPT